MTYNWDSKDDIAIHPKPPRARKIKEDIGADHVLWHLKLSTYNFEGPLLKKGTKL